jgi:hypothetical protein
MKVIIEENVWDDLEDEINQLISEYKTTVAAGLHIFPDGKKWMHYYNHEVITEKISPNLKKRMRDTINEMMNNSDVEWELYDAWINFIEPYHRQNESFHRDHEKDIVLIHYPKINKEMKGGELQWVENENTPQQELKMLKPKSGQSTNVLLLECPQHRVIQVTEGIRWSLIFFCYKKKNKRFL